MKFKIALLTLALVVFPVMMATAQSTTTIYDVLVADGNFKTLVSAIDKANVMEVKKMTGPFTMFAPNDAAFAKLDPAKRDEMFGNVNYLKNIVFYHIIPGKYMVKDLPELKECKTLCPTDESDTLKFTKVSDKPEKYMVSGATIIKADIPASNGIIQVIDTVMRPKLAFPMSK
jgi:uncharacterized surface protein with fasciclin (FAS1) repeats